MVYTGGFQKSCKVMSMYACKFNRYMQKGIIFLRIWLKNSRYERSRLVDFFFTKTAIAIFREIYHHSKLLLPVHLFYQKHYECKNRYFCIMAGFVGNSSIESRMPINFHTYISMAFGGFCKLSVS